MKKEQQWCRYQECCCNVEERDENRMDRSESEPIDDIKGVTVEVEM